MYRNELYQITHKYIQAKREEEGRGSTIYTKNMNVSKIQT